MVIPFFAGVELVVKDAGIDFGEVFLQINWRCSNLSSFMMSAAVAPNPCICRLRRLVDQFDCGKNVAKVPQHYDPVKIPCLRPSDVHVLGGQLRT